MSIIKYLLKNISLNYFIVFLFLLKWLISFENEVLGDVGMGNRKRILGVNVNNNNHHHHHHHNHNNTAHHNTTIILLYPYKRKLK